MSISQITRDVHELTDPRTIPGLVGWYDARYPNGIGSAMPFDGDPISTWTDLSGKGNHLSQAEMVSRPIWNSVIQNPVPYLTDPRWNIAVGHTVVNHTTLACSTNQSNKSGVTIPVPSGNPRYIKIGALSRATGVGTGGSAMTYFGTAYLNAAGVSGPLNLTGYTGNGNAAVVPTDGTWGVREWNIDLGNPEIKFVNIQFSSYQSTPGVEIKDIWATWYMTAPINAYLHSAYIPPVELPGNQPTITFDGMDDSLRLIGFVDTSTQTQYLVLKLINNATNRRDVMTLRGGPNSVGTITQVDSPQTIRAGSKTSNGTFPGHTSTLPSGKLHGYNIYSGRYGDTSIQSWVNGKSYGTPWNGSFVTDTSQKTIQIGGGDSAFSAHIRVAGALLFNEAHDDITRKKVERMLSRTYGIPLEG